MNKGVNINNHDNSTDMINQYSQTIFIILFLSSQWRQLFLRTSRLHTRKNKLSTITVTRRDSQKYQVSPDM